MKQQIIIFVGPDKCGKSTIAKELSLRTGIPYFKASTEHEAFQGGQDRFINDLLYADPRAIDILRQTGASIIMDRGYPCEAVYSKFYNRPTNNSAIDRIDAGYAHMGTLIIFCTRSDFTGWHDDLDESIDSHELENISTLYEAYLRNRSMCPWLKLTVDDGDIERQIHDIERFIEAYEHLATA